MHKEPSSFARRALVCVTGLSPQIVTETLYALLHESAGGRFVPNELHIITTRSGEMRVREQLLGPGQRHLLQFLADYPEAAGGSLAEPTLHVIERDGTALDDIDSPADSEAAANRILEVVARLAADGGRAIHASIAGGRKSMGFLLGYAMSLVGRPQDRVSHVLVSRDFEGLRDFFYPPPKARQLTLGDGRVVSTSDANIRLAEIPVVPLAGALGGDIPSGCTYSDLVQRGKTAIGPLQVVVRPARCEVEVNDFVVRLTPTEMAWYLVFAQVCLRASEASATNAEEDDPRLILIDHNGPDIEKAVLQRAFSRVVDAELPGIDRVKPNYLKPKMSEMRQRFEQVMGRKGAQRVCVAGPRERNVRDGRYGLLLEPGQLRIE